jgi:FKBP-type peptidyl-prolyl cis-trans isomerase SlpA
MRLRALPAAALLLLAACSRSVVPGSVVTFTYTLYVDGAPYDSNEGDVEAQITQGERAVVPGLDDGLLGMKAGEERDITIPPERAYGVHDPDAVETMPLSKFGAMAAQLQVGKKAAGMRHGEPAEGKIVALKDGRVTLDFNHALAGKSVRFHVRVISIR